MFRRRRIHADGRRAGLLRRFAVPSDALNRHLDDDAVHVGAAKAVDAERIFSVVGVFRGAEQGRKAAQVGGVEDRAEIDIKRFRALPGEHFDAGRGIGIDALGCKIFVVLERRRTDVARHRDEFLTPEQLGALLAPHFGDRVALPAGQAFGTRTVELGDSLKLGDWNFRVADVGQGKFQLS